MPLLDEKGRFTWNFRVNIKMMFVTVILIPFDGLNWPISPKSGPALNQDDFRMGPKRKPPYQERGTNAAPPLRHALGKPVIWKTLIPFFMPIRKAHLEVFPLLPRGEKGGMRVILKIFQASYKSHHQRHPHPFPLPLRARAWA